MLRRAVLALLLPLTAACGGSKGPVTVLKDTGSDAMLELARAWAAGFHRKDSQVEIAVSGGGSDAGVAAVIGGTVDIANSTRAITGDELARARASGHTPFEHIVGYDAVAVFLNRGNPVDSLTMPQLAGIYGQGGTDRSWSDFGVAVPGCADGRIVRVDWGEGSGTYQAFHASVLGDRAHAEGARVANGPADVVDIVAHTPCAIGYGSLTEATRDVKTPCVSTSSRSRCIAPSADAAGDGSYALSRPLFMYTAGLPQGAVADYMSWVAGQDGQCMMAKMGYAPAQPVRC